MAENITAGTKFPENLTEKQSNALRGLSFGRASLSASERGDEEIMQLANWGCVNMWNSQFGDVMWEITSFGMRVFHEYERKLQEVEDETAQG